MTQGLEEAKIEVRRSKVREEIIRELYHESDLRPSVLFERIEDRIDTTKDTFYENLSAMTGHTVTKLEGGPRLTLYSLTETGEAVAEELGLTKSEREQLRSYAFESNLSAEEISDILDEVMEEKSNS